MTARQPLSEGRITGQLPASEATQESLMELMTMWFRSEKESYLAILKFRYLQ